MQLDEHLVQTFYLSRPQKVSNSPRNTQKSPQKHQQHLSSSRELHRVSEMITKDKKIQHKSINQFGRILKMITNKMTPSTAVNTPTKINKTHQNKVQSTEKFIDQFEHFSKGFLHCESPNEKKVNSLKSDQNENKKQVKKSGNRTKSLETNRLQSNEEDDQSFVQRLREKKRKMTYNKRIKEQIENKINSVLTQTKFKKYQVKLGHNYTKSNLQKGLWLKTIGKHADRKLQISKAGLTFHLSEADKKYTQNHSKMMQRQMAKKDRLFQKSLSYNNLVTLNSIQNYQKKDLIKKEQKVIIPKKKMRQSHCLKDTRITQNRKKILLEKMRRSCDDLDHLKLREKCLEIEWKCDQSRTGHKQIYKGFKAFEGFNSAMSSIVNVKAQTISKMIDIDQATKIKRNSIKNFADHTQQ